MLFLTVAMVVLGTFLFGAYTLFVIIYLAFEERKISSCFKNLGVEYFATCEYLKQHGYPLWDPHGEHAWDAAGAKRLVEYLEDYRPNQTQAFEFQVVKERFEESLELYEAKVLEYNATVMDFPVCMIASLIDKKPKSI